MASRTSNHNGGVVDLYSDLPCGRRGVWSPTDTELRRGSLCHGDLTPGHQCL